MTTALVISLSDFATDPRVHRQVGFLNERMRVVAAGHGPPAEDLDYVHLERRSLGRPAALLEAARGQGLRTVRRYERAYWNHHSPSDWRDALAGVRADVVVVNDVMALPLAFEVADGAPVVFDAHEHAETQNLDIWWWRLFIRPHVRWMCRTFIPRTAGMMTVSSGIADRYERETGVRPTVVTNAPPYAELEPSAVGPEVRMVHFGRAHPERRLEETLAVMKHLGERYRLDLVFKEENSYSERLRRLAAGDDRIRFLPPIPMSELPAFANGYDIGVHLLPGGHPQLAFALPNKFFEYVQGRLAVALGPSPEMAGLARKWDFGIVSEDFDPAAVARAIEGVTPERLAELKANAGVAARELCAEHNERLVVGIVEAALARRDAAGASA